MTPEELGLRVLAGLTAGREKAIRRAQTRAGALAALVLDLAHADMLAGRPARGRAGRVRRKLSALGRTTSERHVKRILDGLSSVSDSTRSNSNIFPHEEAK